MKAEFIIKADCTMETDEKQTGEELSSYIKGLLRAAGINAKVLIGYLKYEEVMKLERLRKGRSGNSK